jgi:hypothetical protein
VPFGERASGKLGSRPNVPVSNLKSRVSSLKCTGTSAFSAAPTGLPGQTRRESIPPLKRNG